MDRAEQPSTAEYPGDASGAASWENIEESPPRPFPQRVPEFTHGERFPGMNYEHGLMNNEASLMTNENSSSLRDDDKSCFIASTTFSFLVAMTVAFGLYGSETLRLGPNTSMLIAPNHLFVESVKVVELGAAEGTKLYGFYRNPPLDVSVEWSETHKITLPPSTHKEWIYYLNEGSQINISYSVDSLSSSSILLVIAEGNEGLAKWLTDPSDPSTTLSWSIIHGEEMAQFRRLYLNLLPITLQLVHLDTRIKAFLYNTTEPYYTCIPAEGQCNFRLFLQGGNVAVLTSPGRMPGIVGADWYVKLSYGPRWVIYLFGTGGLAFLLLLINYFLNHFRRTDRDTRSDQLGGVESERNPLLSHKDDNLSSSGSSYASVSEDDEHDAQGGAVQSGKPVKDDEDSRRLCAICFDAPKDCFFLPCGHCVACFACATR
ncbi:UNVERIFIED_CONTAM: E3 ubiquitin-protein ligase APD2 [Sesamum radiatum]|uniref:E3 ubiquitin-protein ligase APD2 n=1 Tax=Sesamum radiatum TaxID=300843 RepID=A0AAW2R5F8_SESRA